MNADLAIVGGGPAGLATAIHAARRGFDVMVVERREREKPCGEGLMPAGLRELQLLGARVDGMPFHGIRYVQEDGSALEARFRNGSGLGVRRRVLATELARLADAAGVRTVHAGVRALALEPGGVRIATDADPISARLVVGADGLGSVVRSATGLDRGGRLIRRFGLRAHYALPPPSPFVEVHWADGAEAYVTPTGASEINVAFLWEPSRVDRRELWSRFPRVRALVDGARADEPPAGAGPLARKAVSIVGERVALVGDAAGYVDAITGQGLSLAFAGARLLVEALPHTLEDGARLDAALHRYAAEMRARYRSYALPAASLLWLARRPGLRRRALQLVRAWPGAFESLLALVARG